MSGDNQCGRCGEDHDCDAAAKTCATCRFFGSPAPLTWFIYAEGEDASADEDGESEHHYCARIEHGNGGTSQQTKRLGTDLAVVTDGSGYAARLRVLPTFGCALYEAKT